MTTCARFVKHIIPNPIRDCRRRLSVLLFSPLAAVALTHCATHPFVDPHEHARQLAARYGFTEHHVDAGAFTLLVMHRSLDRPEIRPVVYIEGDGRAYVSRRRASADPTPRDPIALRMAIADPSPAVVYIARPCQFCMSTACEPLYWTTHRYAEAVVAAVDEALDWIGGRANGTGYGLVGYSGGGVIAALLAQRRTDIEWLVTAAAPLDHVAWTAHHGDTPLAGSLNPAAAPETLAKLPQLHLAGTRDKTVPPELIEAFVRKLPAGAPAAFRSIEGMPHDGWADRWRELICEVEYWGETC